MAAADPGVALDVSGKILDFPGVILEWRGHPGSPGATRGHPGSPGATRGHRNECKIKFLVASGDPGVALDVSVWSWTSLV